MPKLTEDICPTCGHAKSEWHCGSVGPAIQDADVYICFCPLKLWLRFPEDALADMVKLCPK